MQGIKSHVSGCDKLLSLRVCCQIGIQGPKPLLKDHHTNSFKKETWINRAVKS